MKNENKTRSSPQRCRQPGSSREGEQRGARASPRRGAGGMEGTEGNRGFGVAAPPPPRCPRSPCCELCRRRPWHPGPGGPRCSRGSLGCSASPAAPLREGGESTRVTPRGAAGLLQPHHRTPAFIRPGLAMHGEKKPTVGHSPWPAAASLLPRQHRAGNTTRRAAHGRSC